MGFHLLAVSRAATTAHQSPVWFTRLACALTLCSCLSCGDPGPAQDEAMAIGKTVVDFRQPAVDFPGVAPNNSLRDHDYFRDMDGRVELTNEEVLGRNTWLVWTAGNQAFWDFLANRSFGALDLLKLLSSYPYQRGDHPGYGFSRDNRFAYLGLMNEPEFEKPSGPDEFGLWLDRRRPDARPEPFDEAVYGQASGVVGLRLFPNPAFDDGARARWDPERYYTDRDYYYDRDLVRPYRVGMACGFCHVGPHPLNPPEDPENPQWSNMSSNVGAQYFWTGRIFGYELGRDNFLWQWFNSSPPGTLETSMVATDNINNPRTMNAIYEVGARLGASREEELAGGTLAIPGTERRMDVPHILKDGSDAVGILGALSRVYLNIGEYHQEWVRHFNPLVGGRAQSPIEVSVAQANSVYWQATAERVENLAAFFVKAAGAHRLEDAPGGSAYLTGSAATLDRGKVAFAEQCARCHSSKQPSGVQPGTDEYVRLMTQAVRRPNFRDNNFLSTDRRYAVTEAGLRTNACAALASNATRGHIWDNFSSETYKTLPAVGDIDLMVPVRAATGLRDAYASMPVFSAPDGGRGYYRAPSLVSMWSTAPYLHNNGLGKFTNDPSVDGRMEAFDDAVRKLLWPELRVTPENRPDSECVQRWNLPFCAPVYLTTDTSYIVINKGFLPKKLRPLLGWRRFFGMGGDLRIGPIPRGTPISLLANINLQIELDRIPELIGLLIDVKRALRRIEREQLDPEESVAVWAELVPELLGMSNCPDLVVNRGHTFGEELSDADREALIEFLKTL